jgi:hypothetical protein
MLSFHNDQCGSNLKAKTGPQVYIRLSKTLRQVRLCCSRLVRFKIQCMLILKRTNCEFKRAGENSCLAASIHSNTLNKSN